MRNIFITGANRGLGLAFVLHFLKNGDKVYAACRNPDTANDLLTYQKQYPKQLEILTLDLAKIQDIALLKQSFQDVPLDVLINNAGVFGPSGMDIGHVEAKAWNEVFQVNTVAPIMLTQALLENIKQGKDKKLIFITSRMASIEDNSSGGRYIYRSTKAALNAAVHSLAFVLKEEGIICLLLHPGWVQTAMGGDNAELAPEESSRRLITLFEKTKLSDSGKFISHTGEILPW